MTRAEAIVLYEAWRKIDAASQRIQTAQVRTAQSAAEQLESARLELASVVMSLTAKVDDRQDDGRKSMLRWPEAAEWLKRGHPIRRATWGYGTHLDMINGNEKLRMTRGGDGSHHYFYPGNAETQATDWMVEDGV